MKFSKHSLALMRACAPLAAVGLMSAAVWADQSNVQNARDSQQQRQTQQQPSTSANEQAGGSSASAANNSRQNEPAQQGQQGQQARRGQQQQANAPEGYVLLSERTVILTAAEPQQHLLRAHALMVKHDNKGAAAEARMAANYLDMQASRVDRRETKTPNALANEADHLRAAADDIQKGKLTEAQANEAFARADVALAEHHQHMAQEYINGKKSLMAGYDLQAAADSFTAALAWAGKEPSPDTSKAIAQARQLSDKLIARDMENQARMREIRRGSAQASNSAARSQEQAQQASARINGERAPAPDQHQQQQQQPQQPQQPQAQAPLPQNAAEIVQNLGEIIQKQGHQIQTQSAAGSGNSDRTSSNSSNNSGQPGQSRQQNSSSPQR